MASQLHTEALHDGCKQRFYQEFKPSKHVKLPCLKPTVYHLVLCLINLFLSRLPGNTNDADPR